MADNVNKILLGEPISSLTNKINTNFTKLDEEVSKKVESKEGFGLSQNDFTDEYKGNLDALVDMKDKDQFGRVDDVRVNGESVVIDKIANINLSHLASKSELETGLTGKVDKVEGKQLSTNDYTTAEKTKLESLHNYDDSGVKADILTLQTDKANKSEIPDVGSFITRTVADLENYYTKSQTYTQDEINQRISSIPKFNIQAVSSLPTTNISETTVYLLKSNATATDNLYEEYIYVGGVWELLGTQKVDLSGYQTIEAFNVAIANYYTKSETDNLLATKVGYKDAIEIDGDVNPLKAYYTKAEVEELLANVKPNVDIVNENLLINGNFAIDQKGLGYYNCITKMYTVDRWLGYAGMKFQKLERGATIYNTHASKKGWFKQILEKPYSEFAGKDVTISLKMGDTVYWGSCVVPTEIPTEETLLIEVNMGNHGGFEDAVLAFACSAEGVLSAALYVTCGASMTVDYIKLELAANPTEFIPRPAAEELALCQRYVQVFKATAENHYIGMAMTAGVDGLRNVSKHILQIPLVAQLRTNPTFRKAGNVWVVQGLKQEHVDSIAYNNYNRNLVTLTLSAGEITDGVPLFADGTITMAMMSDVTGRIELDAEIY